MPNFKFTDVSYAVPLPKKSSAESDDGSLSSEVSKSSKSSKSSHNPRREKSILTRISGTVAAGEVLGIMGPSGAGKTTLLNVLTLTAEGGKASGSITLNGQQLTNTTFQNQAVVVEQFSRNWEHLTPREAVCYAAALYLPSATKDERSEMVENMLAKMGLLDCSDTKTGGRLFQGLSGGQQKRLSLAIALIKKPSLVFLDEPTSGLDSASSTAIMHFISTLARTESICIVVTIHQPSQRVYDVLSTVMLLSSGRLAYNGPATEAAVYFESLGHSLPPSLSIAEFMLDLINSEFTDKHSVNTLLDSWETAKAPSPDAPIDDNDETTSSPVAPSSAITHQICVLLRRQMKLLIRDPLVYSGRAAAFFLTCAFFSVVYVASRHREQNQVLNKLFLNMWIVGVPCCLGTVVVFSYTNEFASIASEVKNGMVNVPSYFISNLIIQIPALFVLAFFALLPEYAFVNWEWNNFGEMLVLYTSTLLAFEAFAQLIAATVVDPLIGMLFFMNYWFCNFLFAGILIPIEMVIWPFRLICYVTPLRYTFTGMAYLEFSGTFSGAALCDTANAENCFYHFDETGQSELPGWTCVTGDQKAGDATEFVCYGVTGGQILDTLGTQYSILSSNNTVWEDIGVNLGIFGIFKVMLLGALWWKCRKHTKVEVALVEAVI